MTLRLVILAESQHSILCTFCAGNSASCFFSHDDAPRLKQLSVNQRYISTRGYCYFKSLILVRVLSFFRKKKMEMAKSLNTTAVRECARSYRAHHTIFVVWHKPAETWPKWILDIFTWSFGQLKNRIPKKIQRTIAVLWICTAPLFSCGIEKKTRLTKSVCHIIELS